MAFEQPNIVVNRTKIIATIGPSSANRDVLRQMIIEGLDVCRLNFSHGDYDAAKNTIEIIHELNKELRTHVALLADLQGPKIRIGDIGEGGRQINDGELLTFTTRKCEPNADVIYITYPTFPKDVKPGECLLIDDGKLMLEVVDSDNNEKVITKVIHGGILKSRKGVNLPNTKISLPCLTQKDLEDLQFALDNKVQWIALSFVRSADDIKDLRKIIAAHKHWKKPLIIAKIEKPEALNEIDKIIGLADGIMVARGDLGVEMPLEKVPLIQKNLVKKCIEASKPIIIATQMMEGMISNFFPTRAEVNDVANAVMDGADACMLSGETSVGQYPIEVIKTMQRIIAEVEQYEGLYYKEKQITDRGDGRYHSDAVICSATELAKRVGATAIVANTHSGYSAFRISSHRPKSKIYIFTNNHSILSKLSLVWGVKGFYYDKFVSTDQTIDDVLNKLKKANCAKNGDFVVNIASTPLSELGKTNMLKLSRVE